MNNSNGPLFKSIPPPVLAKHYTLLALLLFINITCWLILVIMFPPSSHLFLSLMGIMIGVMFAELFPIYFIYSGLSKEQSISTIPHFCEFLLTCVSFLSIGIPGMWASYLLRAHQMCSDECLSACDMSETIFFIPLLFAIPQVAIFIYRLFLLLQTNMLVTASFVSLGTELTNSY